MDFPLVLISGNYNAFLDGFHLETCGTYMVSGKFTTESVKNPIYIGSSKNIEERIQASHIPKLNRFQHENIYLNRSWLKYGQNEFVWFLLEESTLDTQESNEQKYLDIYRPFADERDGYNICKNAFCPPMRSGESHHFFGVKRPEVGEKNKERCAKPFKLLSPFGEVTSGVNLAEFAQRNGLDRGNLLKVINGKVKQHKGWRNADNPDFSDNERKLTPFYFKNPEGQIISGINLNQFCKSNNLDHGALINVRKGKASHHKGWTRA